MEISILFENSNYLIINKPAGLVVHADGKTDEPTVVDWVLEQYPEIAGVGEPLMVEGEKGQRISIDRPGIVHRIDRDTSGCLVIAKHQEAFLYLKSQFQNHTVEKTYLAIVYGHPKNDSGTISTPIGRSKKDFRRWTAQRDARGTLREAVTQYKVVKRFNCSTSDVEQLGQREEKYSVVEFVPRTGRTHQIRVHAKYMNHPIVSDTLYAGKRQPALGLTRHALHAWKIRFGDLDGHEITAEAPFPSDFAKILEN